MVCDDENEIIQLILEQINAELDEIIELQENDYKTRSKNE